MKKSLAEIRGKIEELKNGAHFYRADMHLPVELFINERDACMEAIREKKVHIVSLVGERLDDIILALDDLNTGKLDFHPLIGYWLKIRWPNEDIGILALYDAPHSDYKIKKLIDYLDYEEETQTIKDEKSISKILELIHSDNGLAIYCPYHKEQIENLQENKRLLISLKEDGFDGIDLYSKENLDLYMDEASGFSSVAGFLSSRAKKIEEIGKTVTYMKMITPCFEGVQASLKDTISRTRLSDDFATPFHRIVGIQVEGNFFEDQPFHFNPNLNCILGGKGTGKTSVIELLRFAFHLKYPLDLKNYILRNEDQYLDFLLKEGTVYVVIENANGTQFLISRSILDEEPHVYTEKGEEIFTDFSSGGIFSIDIIGWSEIEYRSQNPREILKMIDLCDSKFFRLRKEIELVKEEIYDFGNELIEVRREGAVNLKKLKELMGKKEELQLLKESEFHQLVENYDIRIRRNFLLDSAIQSMEEWIGNLNFQLNNDSYTQFKEFAKTKSLYVPEVNDLLKEIDEEYNKSFPKAHAAASKLSKKLTKLVETLLDKKKKLEVANEKEYQETLKEKRKHGSVIKDLIKKITSISYQIQQIPMVRKNQLEIQERFQEMRDCLALKIQELTELLKEQQIKREEVTKIINSDLIPDVNIRYHEFYLKPEFSAQFEILCNEYPDEKYRSILHEKMLRMENQLLRLCDFNFITNKKSLMDTLMVNEKQAVSISRFLVKNFLIILQIMTFDFDPLPELSFRGRPVHQLSAGQRCTTVLPVLLTIGNHPLVIDQPEDNLDNAYIFEQIVQPMRKRLKGKRQILLVTHNPNIPVSGDAEMAFIMEANDSNGWVKLSGYIDDEQTHAEIQNILEGGTEAFHIRQQKYGY